LKNRIDFSEHHLLKLIYNALMSISFIHMTNVMHRDIKPANILLSSNCEVKICDFGLARSLPECVNENLNSLKLRNIAQEKFKIKDTWAK
jgi:serine/threonine protein kinase